MHSNNTQLLVQMVQEDWFQEPPTEPQSDEVPVPGLPKLFSKYFRAFINSFTCVKQQLGPAFLAAAASGNVEAGKVLLSYCPDLLDYALWECSALIQKYIILDVDMPPSRGGPFLEVIPFVSQLHRAGFKRLKLEERPERVTAMLVDLCRHNQRHQPESVQMMLDLGVVSCDECVKYTPSKDFQPRRYFEVDCPIIAVAVAEQNAGAVAVLVAAGAVLPAPALRNLPFNHNDLQAVLEELEQQAAAAGGGEMAILYRAASETVRGYCEQHGREKIEGSFITDAL